MTGPLRSLRARIVLAFVVFGVLVLVVVGGATWVLLRDLHRDSNSSALADLAVPYVAQARDRLASVPVDGTAQLRQYLTDTRDQLESSGINVYLARDDGTLISLDRGMVGTTQPIDLSAGTQPGQISRGVIQIPGTGMQVYAATVLFGDRTPGGARSLVLTRADDSGRLALNDLARGLLITALLLLLAGVPLALWLTRSVERPLKRLADGAAAVARSQTPTPLPMDGPVEVATATAAFNTMAAELAASREHQSRILADIRHDLRTPLTVIGGFAEALRDGTARGDNAQSAATAIAQETARLERMVDDLASLAELDTTIQPLTLAQVDASAVVRAAADRFTGAARSRGQEVSVRGANVSLGVYADVAALDRVLSNLASNASAHAPSPGGHLWFEADPLDRFDSRGAAIGWSGPGIVIAVRDDGPGIPSEALPHVFERFYRADPARSGPGSGLGLAIVAELARLQGGTAFAEAVPGGGARVGIVLPALSVASQPVTGAVQPAA